MQSKNLTGLDALGNYNSTLATQTPNFEIPILKPVEIPRDMNNIKGERIYSSDGKLVQIIDEDAEIKKVYKPMENGISYSVIDKNVNKEIFFKGIGITLMRLCLRVIILIMDIDMLQLMKTMSL